MLYHTTITLMSCALLISVFTSAFANDDIFIFTEIDKNSDMYTRFVETQQILKNENHKSALPTTMAASSERLNDLSKRLNVSPEFLQFLAGTQFSPNLMGSGSIDGKVKFFAAIDVGDVERKSVFNQPVNAANSINNIPSNTVFSSAKHGWFSTDYPEINSNLRCDWSVNLRIKTLLDEQAALKIEAELEENYRKNLDGVDIQQGQQNVIAEDESQDDIILDDESADGLHKTIELAGIPCLVTYYCDDIDWPCSTEKLNEIVARVRLVSVGE